MYTLLKFNSKRSENISRAPKGSDFIVFQPLFLGVELLNFGGGHVSNFGYPPGNETYPTGMEEENHRDPATYNRDMLVPRRVLMQKMGNFESLIIILPRFKALDNL